MGYTGTRGDTRGRCCLLMGKCAIVNIAKKKTQDECGELDGVGTGKYRQCPVYNCMVQVLHGITGVHDQEQSPVPGY